LYCPFCCQEQRRTPSPPIHEAPLSFTSSRRATTPRRLITTPSARFFYYASWACTYLTHRYISLLNIYTGSRSWYFRQREKNKKSKHCWPYWESVLLLENERGEKLTHRYMSSINIYNRSRFCLQQIGKQQRCWPNEKVLFYKNEGGEKPKWIPLALMTSMANSMVTLHHNIFFLKLTFTNVMWHNTNGDVESLFAFGDRFFFWWGLGFFFGGFFFG
jgi:hypothetical protein